MIHNFTYIQQHFIEWSIQGYVGIFGVGIFWAIMFTTIGGYIYLKQQSVVAWAVGMLIIIAAFGNSIMGITLWVSFMQIVIALVFMGLFLVFITRIRR